MVSPFICRRWSLQVLFALAPLFMQRAAARQKGNPDLKYHMHVIFEDNFAKMLGGFRALQKLYVLLDC